MKQPKPLVFFLDRSLGKKIIASQMRQAGVVVEVHDDHFPQNCPDAVWLQRAGEEKWLVLTKDKRIRYRTSEWAALLASGVQAFVLTGGDLSGSEMAAIFLKARARMQELAAKNTGPFVATVTKGGEVHVIIS